MHLYKIFRASLSKIPVVLLLIALLLPAPAFSLDSDDSQIFITGFNAYQKRDYKTAIDNMSGLLKKYPDTPLKDMAIFWLARAHYKVGNNAEAGKYMAQFLHDYPESPLKATVEDDLLRLADQYQKGQPIAAAPKTAAQPAVDKAAAEKAAAAQKAAAAKAAADKAAAAKAAADKAAAEKAAAEKAAAEKAAAEKAAAEKAAAEKAAAEKAAAEKTAAAKVAAQKAAAEKAAQKAEVKKSAKAKKPGAEKGKSAALRNKAIAAYKDVIDRYPGTPAASNASAKLLQMGIQYPAMTGTGTPAAASEVTQVFEIEVAQFADVDVELGPAAETLEAGKPFAIPMVIVNRGNGSDSFNLESGFPPEYGFHFAAASTPDAAINKTPNLAVGEKFRLLGVGTIPRANIDGQKNSYPVKVTSVFARETSQTREIALVTSAPLLRGVVKTDKAKLLPGEKVSYRISLLNIGSAPARGVTFRLNYPPQYEPVGVPAGFKQEEKGALVMDGMRLKSGESQDLNLTFRLKDEALADQELFVRADLLNGELDKKESFVSATTVVQKVSGVTARTTADKLTVIPGQIVAVPLIVTNTGNVREVFSIKATVPANATYNFYEDLNRDGKRQSTEPIINHVGPLSPKEEAYVVFEIETPASAADGAAASASVRFDSENAPDRSAAVQLQLAYSRPLLELSLAARGGKLKPGEVSSLELNCMNRGTNLAKQVTLQSVLPAQLELVAADPSFSRFDNGVYVWRFDELGAGEKRNIKVTYRVKPGIAVGTSVQMKNSLSYQDLLGNRY